MQSRYRRIALPAVTVGKASALCAFLSELNTCYEPIGRNVNCCSQVFDAQGAGLEFVVYDAGELNVQQDNPCLCPWKCSAS